VSRKKKSGRLGSSFSDYLKSEGSYEETSTVAVKRVLAWQLEEAMRRAGMTKNETRAAASWIASSIQATPRYSSTASSKPRMSSGAT
jgi:antitoxin HicB